MNQVKAGAKDCPICKGTGWVCEEHPDKPWEHDGCGGAGGRCVCNPEGVVDWARVYAERAADGDKPKQ